MMSKSHMLACAGLLFVAHAANAQNSGAQPPIDGTRLDVSAEGSVTRAPDIATINAGVVTQAPTAAAAMQENARRMTATVTALKSAGVADRDIQTASVNLSPQYRYVENKAPEITGYQASNQVSVRFRDIKRAGNILDTLVAQGANQINGPVFSVEKAEAALDEARVAAIKTARERADLYAQAAGLRVKRIISISESQSYSPPPSPMPMMMARAEKAADTAIEPGEQELSVNVSVSFELQ
ncbi:MAG: SIMPL domain-containing protein [Sphingomonadaceae bacterium]